MQSTANFKRLSIYNFASVLQRTYIQELNWQKVTRKHEKFAAKKETHITLDFMCGI